MTGAESPPLGNAYAKAETTNQLERRLVDGFERALDAMLPGGATRVLDIGCGEGHHLATIADRYPHATVAGVDIAPAEWLAKFRTDRATLISSDACALPFADNRFDVVLALEVLEHVANPAAAIAEIARVCAGYAILSVPWEPVWRAGNMLRGRYVHEFGNTPGHVQHFARRRFVRLVGDHFHVESVRRPLPWTVVRARPRKPS